MSAQVGNSLGDRLRGLRESRRMTQVALAQALGYASADGKSPSDSSISLWERDQMPPGDRWLEAYAKVFGVRDEASAAPGGVDVAAGQEELLAQLLSLRNRLTETRPSRTTAPPEEAQPTFWRFRDGQPITIVATPMYAKWVQRIAYADPYHPNFIESLRNADMDATVKLVLHLTRTNPDSQIEYLTHDRLRAKHFTGHLVVLGGADTSLAGSNGESSPTEQRTRSELGRYLHDLKLPLFARLPEDGEDEYDTEFVVLTDADGRPVFNGRREEVFAPAFATYRIGDRDEREFVNNYPQLDYDVGLLVRQINPSNSETTLTICSGVFSRGTLGAVAATTDEPLASQNETFVRDTFGAPDRPEMPRFWMLFKVPVRRTSEGATTLLPELRSSMLRGAAL